MEASDEVAAVVVRLAVNEGDLFVLLRGSINRWTLARTHAGWRIVERVNRVLDGGTAAKTLLESVARR